MSYSISLHETGLQDANWSFDSSAPMWRPVVDGESRYTAATTLDPFPAYGHDLATVKDAIAHVQQMFKPKWDVHLYVSDREHVGRTNAFSTYANNYYGDDKDTRPVDYGVIFMAGKRIPPHPAMTRHLVAHEYGHQVEWMLDVATGGRLDQREFIKRYAEVRGLNALHHGDGGNWHNAPSEIFACDFRILACGLEIEYWPHPGVPEPQADYRLVAWWDDILRRFA